MKKLLIFLGALALQAQTVSLSDTLTNAVGGGSFTGRITVTLNAPGSASPLYYSTTSLTGWQAVYCLGVTGSDCTTTTAAGVFAATLYANSTITPAGTSYSARFTPAKGSPWSEVWVITPSTTTLRQIRATTVPTPTTTFQASQLALAAGSMVYGSSAGVGTALAAGSNGQVLALSGGYPSWSAIAACSTCVVTSGSYADPAWLTSLAGSKVSGAVASATAATTATSATTATALAANGTNCAAGTFPLGVDASGNSESCTALPTTITGTANQITASASTGAVTLSLPTTITGLTSVTSTGFTGALTGNASTATALATPRTIAGVSFNGTANISIASTNLSDTANIVRNNAANTYTAGSKQTFAHSATTAGLNVGVQATAPSSPAQGDVFFNSTLTRKGVYDGTQWRYELYAPSSGTGVVSWDGTSLSASTTLAGLSSVTSTSFVGALTGNASTATALASSVASGRLWIGQGTGVPTSDSVICADTTNHRLGVGTCSPGQTLTVVGGNTILPASPYSLYIGGVTDSAVDGMRFVNAGAASYLDIKGATGLILRSDNSTGSTERLRLVSGTGDLLIGTATDLGYGLHAANKGTNGNFLCFDPTATTGVTTCEMKAGQGQSTNSLLVVRTYSGSDLFRIRGDGYLQLANGGDIDIYTGNYTTSKVLLGPNISNGISLASDMRLNFSSTTATGGTKDLGLARAAAGVLEINNGTAGTYRDLVARIHTWTNGTEGTCSSTTRGQVVMVQGGAGVADTLRVCRKDAADAYAWTALY